MNPRSVKTDIIYNGVDANIHLSDVMSDFSYSDATEESDSISITIHDPDEKWSDAWMPVNGDKIQAGIVLQNWLKEGDGQELRCGDFVVDSFRLSSPPQMLVIDGVSSPVDLDFKETKRTQTWEKVTIRQIAAEISERYNLTLIYDTAQDITLDREEQNEKTDSTYLKELCNKYGLGLKVYASQIVIWSYEEYEAKEPVLTITPEMVRKWSYKGSIQGTYTGAKVTYTDPKKSEKVEAFVGEEGRVLTVNEKAESIADAERIGKNAIRNANRKEVTMDITLLPTSQVIAAGIVYLKGFRKIDGIYFISKANHKITKNDYSVQLYLYRIGQKSEPNKQNEGEQSGGQYIVKSGDTLWSIAKTFYQDGSKCTIIYGANKGTIEAEAKKRGKKNSENGYWIYPGTELMMPEGET